MIWTLNFSLTIANCILMQLKVSMLQLELKVKYWWWCTDESLLYCQCSCSFQFNTIKSLIVNYLTWVMCSPHFSPAPCGAQPGPRGEPSGPGGGGWRLLWVSHQGPSLSLQSDLEAQCKTIFFFPKTQYTICPSREMPITTRHPGYSKIQFVNGLFRVRVWKFIHVQATEKSSPTRAWSFRRWRRRTPGTTPARPSTSRGRWSRSPSCWTSCVSCSFKCKYWKKNLPTHFILLQIVRQF